MSPAASVSKNGRFCAHFIPSADPKSCAYQAVISIRPTDMIYSEEISDKHNCYASSQAVLIWLRSKSHRLWCSYSVTLAAWQLYIWQDSNTDKMIIENTLAAHGVFCQWWKEKWCSAFVQYMPGFVWQSLFHISQRQCLGFDFHFSQPIDLLTVFEVLDV